jgi:hypothetical protein
MKVYHGEDEILRRLSSKFYLTSFQARVHITKYDMYGPPVHENGFYAWLGEPRNSNKFYLEIDPATTGIEIQKRIKNDEKLDRDYIITIYNQFHQQLLMPRLLTINFDCQDKTMFRFFRSDQAYPGYPEYTSNYRYDEWGAPNP